MRRLDVMNLGSDRMRFGPWRGDHRFAYLVPLPGRGPSPHSVERAVDQLAAAGFAGVLTAALAHTELDPFIAVGFEEHERLHLLRHDLERLPPPPVHPLRRAGRSRMADVLEIDAAAFDAFWRFDRVGIEEARRATPFARFRVHIDRDAPAPVVAYAISGRANDVAYLQRLAVRPEAQRGGIGWSLVNDALHWARRRRATSMLVNTQEINRSALALYERIGFQLEDHGLTVLWRPLQPVGAAPAGPRP